MRRWLAAGLAVAGLGGCLAATPLPLSPLQLLFGGWPPARSPGLPEFAHTILGDTFSYPDLGFSLTRPDGAAWEFLATAGGVEVLSREGQEVRPTGPSLQVTLVPQPAGRDFPAIAQDELARELKVPGGLVYHVGTLDGVTTVELLLTRPVPAAQGEAARTERRLRVYAAHEGLIALVEARAPEDEFLGALPAFEAMLETLRLPASPSGAQPGGRLARTYTGGVVVPALGATFKTVSPARWLVTASGRTATLERRAVPAGGRLHPALSLTVGDLAASADLAGTLAQQRQALEQPGASVTVASATLLGLPAESWRWSQPASGLQVARRRLTARDGGRLLIVEHLAEAPLAGSLEPEFDELLAGLEVAGLKPQPPATASAR